MHLSDRLYSPVELGVLMPDMSTLLAVRAWRWRAPKVVVGMLDNEGVKPPPFAPPAVVDCGGCGTDGAGLAGS